MQSGAHHKPGRQTEIATAHKIGPDVKGLKDAVLQLAQQSGTVGIIPDEAWQAIESWRPGTPETSIRRRFNDLWEDGLLIRNGHVRANRRGNNEEVWICGRDAEGVAKKQEVRGKVLQTERLRDRVQELESQLLSGVAMCPGCFSGGKIKVISEAGLNYIKSGRTVVCSDCGLRMSPKA